MFDFAIYNGKLSTRKRVLRKNRIRFTVSQREQAAPFPSLPVHSFVTSRGEAENGDVGSNRRLSFRLRAVIRRRDRRRRCEVEDVEGSQGQGSG